MYWRLNVIIAIDFDGTIVKHTLKNLGPPVPGAKEALLEMQDRGHAIILWTSRSELRYTQASDYMQEELGIVLLSSKSWRQGGKVYADLYIDDKGYNVPLVHVPNEQPYFDWTKFRMPLHD